MERSSIAKRIFKRKTKKSNEVCVSVFFDSYQEPAKREDYGESSEDERSNQEVGGKVIKQRRTRRALKRVLKEEYNNNVKRPRHIDYSVHQTRNNKVNCSTFKDFVSKKFIPKHMETCNYCNKLNLFFKNKLNCNCLKDFVSKKYIPDHLKKCRYCLKLQLFFKGFS